MCEINDQGSTCVESHLQLLLICAYVLGNTVSVSTLWGGIQEGEGDSRRWNYTRTGKGPDFIRLCLAKVAVSSSSKQ